MRGTLVTFLILTVFSGALAQDGSRLRQAFERLDSNGDSKLSAAELNVAPQLKNRIEGADGNGDGLLSFDEFSGAIIRSMRGTAPAPETEKAFGPGDHTRTVKVGELQRRYEVHVPASYDPEKPTPVVIAFHGGGGNPQTMIPISQMNDKSDEAGFIVVYPYGSGPDPDRFLTFNGGECCGYAMHQEIDDVGFVRALLDDLGSVATVDEGAIFATGLSNGGIMSYRLAAELSDRIAAIAPVGGPLMMEAIEPSHPVAVMHFHGTDDKFAPFKGGFGQNSRGGNGVTEFRSVEYSIQAWVKANGCSAEPTVESLPDAADDGMRVTRKIWGNGRDGTEVVSIEIEQRCPKSGVIIWRKVL